MFTDYPESSIVLALLLIAFVRFIYFQVKLRSITTYRNQYQNYWNALSTNAQDWDTFDQFAESRSEIIRLFEQAGLKPETVTVFKNSPIGNNLKFQSGSAQPWDNLTSTDEHIVFSNRKTFHEAIGYYRARRNETFSITYWIDVIIFHPRKIVAALGGNRDGMVATLLNVVALPSEAIAIYEWFLEQ